MQLGQVSLMHEVVGQRDPDWLRLAAVRRGRLAMAYLVLCAGYRAEVLRPSVLSSLCWSLRGRDRQILETLMKRRQVTTL